MLTAGVKVNESIYPKVLYTVDSNEPVECSYLLCGIKGET